MVAKDLEEVQKELKWIQVQEQRDSSFIGRFTSKGIMGFLVPAGCLVTAGVLASGVYQMYNRNSKKQQLFMRCRVAAQAVTVLLALISITGIPQRESKCETN